MSLFYTVELVISDEDYNEILGKFNSLINSYDYISKYSNLNKFKMIMEYKDLSDDQRKGSIISVNNIKKPTKFIFLKSDVSKRRKLTM